MCGIVAYTGFKRASEVLIETLAKLEYRGYDSVGIAVFEDDNIVTRKTKGKIKDLKMKMDEQPISENFSGIGHTRWATHGAPSDVNSHPHGLESLYLVHNGIIENYHEIKKDLIESGYTFESETDTEVMAKCLDAFYAETGDVLLSIKRLTQEIKGSYALAILFAHEPDTIYTLRQDSPLIIGIGEKENFIASDMTALLQYTKQYYLLEENEIGIVRKNTIQVLDMDCFKPVHKSIQEANWDESVAEKQGYSYFMMKEIMEQPEVFSRAISGRVKDNKIDFWSIDNIEDAFFEDIDTIHLIGCGTAYHAGLVGQKVIQNFTGKRVMVHIASEFRYDLPPLSDNDLVILITQSGETADTVAAMRAANERGIRTLALCNVIGSTISRECDHCLLLHAQLEIAVASTKAYFAMTIVFYLLAFKLSQMLGTFNYERQQELAEFINLRPKIDKALTDLDTIKKLAKKYVETDNLFFMGRKLDYLLALEASLKLKEISYIHSEAYPAGELKHGTISLIEKGVPVIALASDESVLEKTLSNVQEVRTRGADVLLITNQPNDNLKDNVDSMLTVEHTSAILACFLMIIPLQLLAYYVAIFRGCDVDQPRNLAKSVTVE